MRSGVPAIRVRAASEAPIRPDGEWVLYWMTAARRVSWSFALDRALEWCRELGKPVVLLEALRCDHPFASDRLHRFVLDGMAENARALAGSGILYHPYVEPRSGAGKGLVHALAERAAVVVGDDSPAFFLPRATAAAAARMRVRFEVVDSNGLLPLRAAGRAFPTAYGFRRLLQRRLPEHLAERPSTAPPSDPELPRLRALPAAVRARWPAASPRLLDGGTAELGHLPIDHRIAPAAARGGAAAADERWRRFLRTGLPRYAAAARHPDDDATSGLSPYLHFGHVSVHRLFADLARRERWRPGELSPRADGKRSGWWRMREETEAFLEQLVTWRELAWNFCAYRDDAARFESLPEWARRTLARHRADPRPVLHSRDGLAAAATGDELWNAAQRQLLREGRIHNSLRMLWGKKILEWSPDAETALAVMLDLNDRYALDGRDPASLGGIFWVLGRYDRPWGPERPIFGTVRYMSSASTRRKLRVREYLERWAAEGVGPPAGGGGRPTRPRARS